MSPDPEIKLKDGSHGGRSRLIVRFRSVPTLLQLYKQVRDNGVFAVPIQGERPASDQLPVLFRSQKRGEEFPAAVQQWADGRVVLEPKIPLPEFKELTTSLVGQLSQESARSLVQSKPTVQAPVKDRSPRSFADTQEATGPLRFVPKTTSKPQSPPADQPTSGLFLRPNSTGRRKVSADHPNLSAPPSSPQATKPVDSAMFASTASVSKIGVELPRDAFRFLDELDLSPQPIGSGEGTGIAALTALQKARESTKQVVLVADCPSEALRWYFFVERSRVLSAYLLPPSIQSSLCVLLARQGLLKPVDAQKALQEAASKGVPEEVAVESIGVISPDILAKAATARAKLLGERLRIQSGVIYKVYELLTPLKLRPKSTRKKTSGFRSVLAKFERMTWAEIDELQDSYLSAYPTFTGNSAELRTKMGLGDKARQFVTNCLNGRYPVRDLPKVSSLSRPKTVALLFALNDVGLVEFERRERTETKRQQVASVIEEQHEKIGVVDDFEFVGVHWTATEPEINEAVARIIEEFDPKNRPELSPTAATQSREIIDQANNIKKRLSSVEARRGYRTEILEPFAVEQACELILSNFDMAMYRDQSDELRRLMSRLQELDPQAALEARERLRTKMKQAKR